MLLAIIFGFLFGFVGSMPVAGPIAALVFARSIDNRSRSARYIALGGGVAEALYAFIAFYGVSTLLSSYPAVLTASQAVAGGITLALGVVFLRRKTDHEPPEHTTADRPWNSIVLGFLICVLNPSLIATWTAAAAILAGTGVVLFIPSLALPFSASAGVGIISWYAVLIFLITRYKDRFSRQMLNRVIQVMGVFLIGIGIWFFVVFFQKIGWL